ncbi:ubiquitin interaction motif family protein [Cardiosporidium cionae]|uniref:Ubiquitin interaction motif family protein n=1 Tax=Cardiosporidium cionae TaxID=476202 RepID=A0ABQ7JFF7_9APIC|nr:ubiquitin interaction motif family protein [Cardiosporidium cionae]|eukprot:KAF8822708.1 ubiquitin interaction motif family protein [Cardiosporidium cionae]
MVECVVLCLDNSEWMRNGDYPPTRFESQLDAAHFLAGYSSTANQENSVAILSMGGFRVEIRVNPTNDIGKLLAAVHGIKLDGSSDFIRGIQTAQLILKHRSNKRQDQRIICFVGSPILVNEKQLVLLGRNLKKNNISLDLISFGDVEMNKEKLNKLHQAVNNAETSTFLECLPYSDLSIRDVILSSPLVHNNKTEGNPAAPGMQNEGGVVNEFGVDPAADPELYMALRMSLVEQEARQEESKTTQEAPSTEGVAASGAAISAIAGTSAEEGHSLPIAGSTSEKLDADLEAALSSSLEETVDKDGDIEMTAKSEPAILSSEEKSAVSTFPTRPGLFSDPAYMESLLVGLGGVDMQDPRIQEMLQKAGSTTETSTDDKEAKTEEKKKDCEESGRK